MRTGLERLGRVWRRSSGLLAIMMASWTIAGTAIADVAKVIVPLSCAVERGRLVVSAAAERAHPIIGQRSSHAFTTCAAGKMPRCRTFMVHKFDLSCDGLRVSWLGLMGAALERDDPRVRVVANRFTLRMPPGWNAGRSGTVASELDVVAFPVGFAPSMKIPSRFIGSNEPAPTVTTWDRPKPDDKLVRVASSSPVIVSGGAQITTSSTVPIAAPREDASSWLTTVEPVARALGTSRERLGALAAAVAFAWGVLFAVRRRVMTPSKPRAGDAYTSQRALPPPQTTESEAKAGQTAQPPHPEADNDTGPRTAATDGDTYAAHCARMISDAVTLHKATRETVNVIGHGSLRAVLQEDLDKVQEVLLEPDLAADIASGLWTKVEISVTGALADLDRIGRIVAGVTNAAVPDAMRQASALPESAADAFHLLGVRPDASPLAVKKIVDGLRLSWHPDHARDETDRSIREARLKQINVAWDLIQDQQKAA